MNKYKKLMLTLLMVTSFSAWSEVYWVGDSAACNGSNVHDTLLQALFVAALNGDSADEIRLTNTVEYRGLTNGRYTLTDWSSSGAGVLTLVGGYADCFGSVSGRTLVGDSSDVVFEVNSSANETSNVTFRNIQMSLTSATRALTVDTGASVTLDNVLISSNQSGVAVTGGGFLEVLDNSLIQFNGNTTNVMGGGINCTGNNSSVILRGRMHRNQGTNGGNLYIGDGCFLQIEDGVRIEGRGTIAGLDAINGAGMYIDDGAQVMAFGEANRVIFDGNKAEIGGAIYVNGVSSVILENTHINGSEAELGAAIYAKDGGAGITQLIMDQSTDCNLLFRCSEIQLTRYTDSVIEVDNSRVQLQRTVIEQSDNIGAGLFVSGLVVARFEGVVQLNRVGLIRNESYSILNPVGGEIEATHVTIAANTFLSGGLPFAMADASDSRGVLDLHNSLITDTQGTDSRTSGSITGDCNLVDNDDNLSKFHDGYPMNSYDIGVPQLVNPVAGDARQTSESLGVDMCLQDSFSWSSEIDIENQVAPVNENTNPQGMPGQAGGLFDVGFDEVYDNIGEDEFLLTIQKEGPGEGVVISNPSGISCGSDCSEVFFNGTIVTLFASPITGNEFIGWLNCPLVNQDDECLTSVESSHIIRAVFAPDDLIFYDGFE